MPKPCRPLVWLDEKGVRDVFNTNLAHNGRMHDDFPPLYSFAVSLLATSLAVAGVLARPIVILLETLIGAGENNAREPAPQTHDCD
jgi:hypothetical protein